MVSTEELTYPTKFRGHSVRLLRGEAATDLGLDDWDVTDETLVLGHGEACFSQSVDKLFSWQAHKNAGVSVKEVGEDCVELTLGPTRSRCLILDRHIGPDRAFLLYGSLTGHVLNGEEVFDIELGADGTVTGRCVAFSQPDWIWARIGAPVTRVVQLYLTRKYLQGMKP